MRTIAALTMIMAIVVAAIPVENYGTMQAASGFDMQTVYDTYAQGSYKDSEDMSDGMPGTLGIGSSNQRTIQVIEDGRIQDRYKVNAKSGNTGAEALITEYVGGSSIINISEEMSYGYFLFPGSIVTDLRTKWKDEQYTIKYAVVPGQTINNVTLPNTFDLENIPTSYSTIDPANPNNDTSVGGTVNINGKDCTYTKTSLTVNDLFTGNDAFAGGKFKDYTSSLADYNKEVQLLQEQVEAAGSDAATNPNFTDPDTGQIALLTKRYNDLVKELTVAFTDLQELPGFISGVICSRFSIQTNEINTNYNLNGFKLEYLDANDAFVVKWANSSATDIKADIDANSNNDGGFRSSHVDSKGYLCDGFVRVIGIDGHGTGTDRKGAFQDNTTITEVNLSDQIRYIGDDAFNGCTALSKASLNAKNCTVLGDRSFKRCARLSEISFIAEDGTSSVTTLGAEAFQGCSALTTIDLPTNIQVIGRGCFANTGLTKFVFASDTTGEVTIYPFAFYGCESLGNVDNTFMPSKDGLNYIIGFGAFALSGTSSNGSMESFEFPARMTKIDNRGSKNTEFGAQDVFTAAGATNADGAYDYILAGRKGLKTVIFPANLNGAIPANTLADCENLERAVMGQISFNDSAGRNITYSGEDLFKDVMNGQFRVEGPGYLTNGTDKTQIRKDTLVLKMGIDTNEAGEDLFDYVPYMFKDAEGNNRMELTVGDDGEYLATIDQMDDENRTARLVGYELSKQSGSVKDLIVKSEIGGYRITRLGPGCFDEVKDSIETLTFEDNSVTNIDADALKGSDNLRLVRLPDSVQSIGSGAFENCPKLENVYFGEPAAGSTMTIADGAFKTGAEYLTFHGVIDKDFAPYVYAMDANNTKFNSEDTNICYKSLGPSNLTVMRDNNTGLKTLIDYPHLEEIDDLNKDIISLMVERFVWETTTKPYSIQEKFEGILDAQARATTEYTGQLEDEERALVDAALHLVIPSGVDSIDSKSFFESTALNDKSKEYLELLYDEDGKKVSGSIWRTAIDPKEYYTDTENKDVIGGLFSGFFEEKVFTGSIIKSGKQYNDKTYEEETTKGNDHLTSISLQSVAELPEKYTFDSCENLTNVRMGSELQDIGISPFRGCTSLTSDGIEGNAYFRAENNILYGSQNVGDYSVLEECLTIRDDRVKLSNDPNLANVKEIREEAFSNCENVVEVDLSGTSIDNIPANCFNGATRLREITLPETVKSLSEDALINMDRNVRLVIPNGNCDLGNALETDGSTKYEIFGPMRVSDSEDSETTYLYNYATDPKRKDYITFYDSRNEHVVSFHGADGTVFYEEVVTELNSDVGGIVQNVPMGTEEAVQSPGRIFQHWRWVDKDGKEHIGEEAYRNVKESRDVYPVYELDTSGFDNKPVKIKLENGKNLSGQTEFTVNSGTEIVLVADSIDGKTFQYWQESTGKYNNMFGESHDPAHSTFIVPNENENQTANPDSILTLVAHYTDGGNTPVDPDALYMATVNYGTGGGQYKAGEIVSISANAPGTGRTFSGWTSTSTNVVFTSTTNAETTFIMPAENVVITANYTGEVTNPNEPSNPSGTYTLTVNNGTGGGQFAQGTTVTITANTPNAGASFVNWTTTATGVTFASATASTTTFQMPASNVTVTANFSDGTGGQPSGGNNNNTKKYKVTVNYGSGSGEYAAGATVNITANAPESSSRVFSRWTTNNSGLGFANANSVSTSFVMPAADVTVTANYKVRSDDDDDDDDGPSRRPGTNTTTNTVNNRPSSSTSTTGTNGTVSNTNGTTNNNDGNRIYITKNGISNTDVASLAVSGSTDNFIVRITESPEATAAAEQALTNTYGSLNGLAYLPMDISLYDSTGQNKITDTTGLNITVTMPIPDVLIQYGGNARVAAADNGNLQQLTPRFTTIDGIACISFVPPHFSPYVIYVDTNNLIAGQMLDSTPATGDPIHPKWFAAIGMACVSILLFVLSDGRKRRKYRAA